MKRYSFLMLLFIAGCNSQLLTDLPAFPPIDDLVVTATIRSDETQLRVLVSKPVTASNTPIQYVRGLSVSLIVDGRVLRMRDTIITSLTAAPQPCYFLNGLEFQPGSRYEVRVRTNDKEIVGATTMPENPRVSATMNRLIWSRTSAKFYRVSVSTVSPTTPNSFGFFRVTADTIVTIPDMNDANGTVFSNGRYIIRIESIDENLGRFMQNESLREGLTSGFGVVGSVSIQVDTLMLTRP